MKIRSSAKARSLVASAPRSKPPSTGGGATSGSVTIAKAFDTPASPRVRGAIIKRVRAGFDHAALEELDRHRRRAVVVARHDVHVMAALQQFLCDGLRNPLIQH